MEARNRVEHPRAEKADEKASNRNCTILYGFGSHIIVPTTHTNIKKHNCCAKIETAALCSPSRLTIKYER